jgi:hypothetical protein
MQAGCRHRKRLRGAGLRYAHFADRAEDTPAGLSSALQSTAGPTLRPPVAGLRPNPRSIGISTLHALQDLLAP